MTHPHFSFVEACTDPHLFGPWFTGDSWARWRVVDKALFGERLDHIQRQSRMRFLSQRIYLLKDLGPPTSDR